MTAFNNTLQEFGYTQTLEYYDPHVHQKHPNATTPFLSSIDTNFWHFHSMLTFHHSLDTSLLLPSSSLDDACRCFPLITPPELLHNWHTPLLYALLLMVNKIHLPHRHFGQHYLSTSSLWLISGQQYPSTSSLWSTARTVAHSSNYQSTVLIPVNKSISNWTEIL